MIIRTRRLLALVATLMLPLGAAAQSEYGRASGGAIDVLTKAPRRTSGTLTLSRSTGAYRGAGYEATLGGELLDERVWFFAAASILPSARFSPSQMSAIDVKATAQPVDWTTVTASFSQYRQPVFATTTFTPVDGSLPASFLSLRSTSLLSDRMMLDFSFSRSAATQR